MGVGDAYVGAGGWYSGSGFGLGSGLGFGGTGFLWKWSKNL